MVKGTFVKFLFLRLNSHMQFHLKMIRYCKKNNNKLPNFLDLKSTISICFTYVHTLVFTALSW